MSRAKKKTVAELEADRDRLNKRIAAERKAEKQAEDAEILKAAEELGRAYGITRPNLAANFRKWAEQERRREAQKQAQATTDNSAYGI